MLLDAAVDRVVQLEQHFKVLKEICQEKLEEIEYLKQGHPDLQEVTEGSHDSIGIYKVITDSHMLAMPTKESTFLQRVIIHASVFLE